MPTTLSDRAYQIYEKDRTTNDAVGLSTPSSNEVQDPTIGTKRKRELSHPMKYYAVRVGRRPGIYHSWNDCFQQIDRFPKCAFQSFTTISDAQAFVRGDGSSHKYGVGMNTAKKYYGVQSGRMPGVYTSWPEAQAQIVGWRNPRYKGFKTQEEAESFVNAAPSPTHAADTSQLSTEKAEPGQGAVTKKTKVSKSKKANDNRDTNGNGEEGQIGTGEYVPGEGPFPEGSVDDFDSTLLLDQTTGATRYKSAVELAKTKLQATSPVADAPIRISTDGSALGNGKANATGGIGVYFGPRDRRNISEPLSGTRQTNNRAELTAVLRALEVAPKDRRVIISTDSNYAIKCVTEWFQKWRSNNWCNASNRPVENKDLIIKIIDVLEERMRLYQYRGSLDKTRGSAPEDEDYKGGIRGPWDHGPASVVFEWVKGHDKDEGNVAADEFAVSGAMSARALADEIALD